MLVVRLIRFNFIHAFSLSTKTLKDRHLKKTIAQASTSKFHNQKHQTTMPSYKQDQVESKKDESKETSSATSSENNEKPKPTSPRDIKPEELYRGPKPDGLEQKCAELCRDYLGGVWAKQVKNVEEDIHVSRITGGLTNQLYHVRLSDKLIGEQSADDDDRTPLEVCIKLYMKKHNLMDFAACASEYEERLSDTIIMTLTSHLDIGPRVYGIFPGGLVQAYYKVSEHRTVESSMET